MAITALCAVHARLSGERGQTAAEYLGILLLAGLIIFALATSGIGDQIAERIQSLVKSVGEGTDPRTVTTG